MEWNEITVRTKCENADAAAAILQMVSNGIYIEDYSNLEQNIMEIAHVDLIDEALLQKDREHVLIHAYFALTDIDEIMAYLKERLDKLGMPYELKTAEMRDEDWAENWKQYYKPFEVGEKLIIKPEWENCEPNGRIVLNIEPGLAFGTGTHETTKMSLELLEEYIRDGANVLDVGCGSGILGIAALLLGAENTTAIDIDPIAVRTSRENGVLNGFSEEMLRVIEGDLVEKLTNGMTFDIILANIIADAIIALAPQIREYMKEGCVFICSGIIDTRLNEVLTSLDTNGFTVIRTRCENGWAAVAAAKGEGYAEIF